MKYLLTLLLLFLAPHESALEPVMTDDDTFECSDEYYWENPDYYTWEDCLFDYSGTIDDDPELSNEDHQELFEKVWSDYMGDADPPTLRSGKAAIEEVCAPEDADEDEWPWGCATSRYEPCGPWLTCGVVETVVVRDTTRRLLLHEVAHAVYDATRWHPFWGFGLEGSNLATEGHAIDYRCLLLEIYRTYTGQVADDAYEMLHAVCAANGWTLPN